MATIRMKVKAEVRINKLLKAFLKFEKAYSALQKEVAAAMIISTEYNDNVAQTTDKESK